MIKLRGQSHGAKSLADLAVRVVQKPTKLAAAGDFSACAEAGDDAGLTAQSRIKIL
jgi:hypothetical protein